MIQCILVLYEVDMSNLVTYLNYTPKKSHIQKRLNNVLKNMLTILGSIVNITQGTFMTI